MSSDQAQVAVSAGDDGDKPIREEQRSDEDAIHDLEEAILSAEENLHHSVVHDGPSSPRTRVVATDLVLKYNHLGVRLLSENDIKVQSGAYHNFCTAVEEHNRKRYRTWLLLCRVMVLKGTHDVGIQAFMTLSFSMYRAFAAQCVRMPIRRQFIGTETNMKNAKATADVQRVIDRWPITSHGKGYWLLPQGGTTYSSRIFRGTPRQHSG